ncbi:NAD(P)H-dependent amine dehydrogenase family protein [Nocardioides limicola]|uniref:NAD(P)H-dependent amine dehydrogenase family protein n=1 Tax=Nocardioides limicola TaxID=2803368 RepID=UPI00193BA571|nr:dihydrodipicolinate reductase [Nocardioides sp. DJM-14]
MTTTPDAPIRLFQVATGNVGTEMIKRIGQHPDLELIGVHCYSPEKVGRDVGELAGLDPIGVTATGSVAEIIAAKPDVVTFHGVFPDEELYLQVLEAGIDIVTTADWITGHHRNANHPHPSGRPWTEIIEEACQRGGATFYGTGMNPGLCQILGVVHTADVAEIENVTVIESVDVSCHHSADTWREVGYGLPVDDPALPGMLEKYTSVFADSVWMMADCFGLELDEVAFSYELGACTEDIDLGWYQLPAGSLGANYLKYQGLVDGVPRVEAHLEWQMTPHTEPKWDIQGCYITKIAGDPCIYSKHMIFPKPGTDFSSVAAFASIGMTVTGLPALNAIRSVVAAPPGILTSADMPLRGFAGRFAGPTTEAQPSTSATSGTPGR